METLADRQIADARRFVADRQALFEDFVDHEETVFEVVDVDGDVVLWSATAADSFTATQLEVIPEDPKDLVAISVIGGCLRACFLTRLR